MAVSIQFNNREAVLLAFQNRAVEAWAIWQGKQFMFKGIGESELNEILEVLSNGGTNAVYTLKVFEGVEDASAIKSNTPDDGSFNFRLNSPEMALTQSSYTSALSNIAIAEKLAKLEKRFEEEEEENIEIPVNSLGKIGEILDHPVIAPFVPILIEKIVGVLFGNNEPAKSQAFLPATTLSGIEEETMINEVIRKLKIHDPNLCEHLQKLLEMAEHKPDIFKAVINSL